MLAAPQRSLRLVRSEPDERLVERVRAGEANAFEAIYDRHSPGLLSFCRHLLGSPDEAEDAVQHTFIAAHRALLADDRQIHLKAWLYAIARNRCMSLLRSRRERVGLDDELERVPSTAGLSAEVEEREDLRALLADLGRLPDDQRAALVLSELGAHSHDDIAEVLDVRRDKVKALVFQAREALSAARDARDTPCSEIREQLATARGGALRRGNLRRHLEACAGCRAFRAEVAHQRAAFAILLPVVPSFALKQAVLGGAAASVAGLGGSGGAGAGLAAGGAKAAAVKLMAAVVVAGGAGSAGYVAVHDIRGPHVPTAAADPHAPNRTPTHQRTAAHHLQPVRIFAVRETPSVTPTPLPAAGSTHAAAAPARAKRHGRHGHRGRHRGRGHEKHAPLFLAGAPQPVTKDEDRGEHRGRDGNGKGKGRDTEVFKAKGDDHARVDKPNHDHPRGGPPGQLKKTHAELILAPPGHRRDPHDAGAKGGGDRGGQGGDQSGG